MTINKSNDPKEDLALQKNKNMDGLIKAEDASKEIQAVIESKVSMQKEDRASIYWGDEWNIEEGEKSKRKK